MGLPGQVRFALRSATDDVHQRLHVARPFAEIATGRLDLRGYAALLATLYRFHRLLEIGCASEWTDAPRSTGRIERLVKDLAWVGKRPDHPIPPWSPPPQRGAALGCLYVAQGSTLGGRVIHRQLDYLLPALEGRSFFAGDHADPAQWRALCAHLEEAGRDRDHLNGMIAGAKAAFALFEECLEEEPVLG